MERGGFVTKRKEGRARRKSTSEDYGNDIRFFSLSSSCSSLVSCLFPFAIFSSLSSSPISSYVVTLSLVARKTTVKNKNLLIFGDRWSNTFDGSIEKHFSKTSFFSSDLSRLGTHPGRPSRSIHVEFEARSRKSRSPATNR